MVRHSALFAITFLVACTGPVGTPTAVVPSQTEPGEAVQRSGAWCAGRACLRVACIYVAGGINEPNSDSITVFAQLANGNVPPIKTIAGSNTELQQPVGPAVDAAHKIYVANTSGGGYPSGPGSVTVYAAEASGNAAPIRTIAGSKTALAAPQGIAVDSRGRIYVSNPIGGSGGAGSITVYSAEANGNVAPIRTSISGPNTGLNGCHGIAIGPDGGVFVANEDGGIGGMGSITVFAAKAAGNAEPIRTITGANTGLTNLGSVAVDENGNIYAANLANQSSAAALTIYPAGANGDIAPTRTISGSNTGLAVPIGVAANERGVIYVANEQSYSITAYASHADGNMPPIRTIKGQNTGIFSPNGVTIH